MKKEPIFTGILLDRSQGKGFGILERNGYYTEQVSLQHEPDILYSSKLSRHFQLKVDIRYCSMINTSTSSNEVSP